VREKKEEVEESLEEAEELYLQSITGQIWGGLDNI
jgi:hypothetical protein